MQNFIELFGMLLILITLISLVVKFLKQPIIIGYVIAGVVFAYLYATRDVAEQVMIFSEIGITFLLFLMGLEFDLKSLKYLGKDLLIATLVQSISYFAIGFVLALVLGFDQSQSVFLGILFMFSSTLLVAKWIDDKRETAVLHGKITLSILILQDIIAILILTLMSIMNESSLARIIMVPFEGLVLIGIAYVLSRWGLNRLLGFSSRYPELLFLMSLSVCFLFVNLAPLLGYSITIGAFIGGVVLANTLYKSDILTRLKPLIIFFNMLFFVGLGFQVQIAPEFKVFAFIILAAFLSSTLKPLISYFTLRWRGYDMKTSFVSSLYLAQLSEFGIIIIAGAVSSGAVGSGIGSIAILSVILTMVISSYLIKYDRELFSRFEPSLKRLDSRFITKDTVVEHRSLSFNILMFGYHDLSKSLLERFTHLGKRIVVVENDPENIAILKKESIPYIYSSINNSEFFEHFSFDKLELVISSILDIDENKVIIKEAKRSSPYALVIVTARHLKDSLELYSAGADYVIYTQYLSEQRVSVLLEEFASDTGKIIEKKIMELEKLKDRELKMRGVQGRFHDIHSFISRMRPGKRPRKPDDEVFDYLGIGK
jgi:Kef-type K+ transport system membrane component KefB/Trk K+ transport system NAD-binding subunit